jgi:hypothetical protein
MDTIALDASSCNHDNSAGADTFLHINSMRQCEPKRATAPQGGHTQEGPEGMPPPAKKAPDPENAIS